MDLDAGVSQVVDELVGDGLYHFPLIQPSQKEECHIEKTAKN